MSEKTTIDQHRTRINEYIERFGKERNLSLDPLDEAGIAHVQRGSALVSIHFVPSQGVLLLLSRIMAVPEEDREALYRRLLELSFVATGDGAFAIDKKTDEIYLRALRRLEGLDYGEFEDLVHTVATIADDLDDKLRAEFP